MVWNRDIGILLAVGTLVLFANLGACPLWDRDEPRNASCASEMFQQGNWGIPVFNGELRTHKPILLYWLMMISYSVFGVNELGARAVSSVAGIATVLLTYYIARRLFSVSQRERKIALWSGVVLSTCILFALAARAATPDALLVFCGTLAIFFFVRGTFLDSTTAPTYPMPRGWNLIGMYAAMGLGVLAKGPVGMVLPTAVIGMYLLIVTLARSTTQDTFATRVASWLRPFAPLHFLRTCWRMRPFTALGVAATIAMPWYAWVHWQTDGVWTTEFFFTHNLSRAGSSMEGHTGPPILFYVAAILVGTFPWSIFTIPAALEVVRRLRYQTSAGRNEHNAPPRTGNTTGVKTELTEFKTGGHLCQRKRAIILLLCWVGVYVALFSFAQTKLPSYVTPCYPALAILFGHFMARWAEQLEMARRPIWFKVGLAHWIGIGLAMAVGLPIAAHQWMPGSEWVGLVGFVPLLGGLLCWRWLTQKHSQRTQMGIVATAVGFVCLVMCVLPAEIGRHRADEKLLTTVREHQGPVVAYGRLEPSLVFYAGKPIREYVEQKQQELIEFLHDHPDAMLLTTKEQWHGLAEAMTVMRVVDESEYFLKNRSLVLLGSAGTSEMARQKNDSTQPTVLR